MVIAVDFDGTLHSGKWPSIGEPQPWAIDSMKRLKEDGHYLIIWTCREGREQTEMVNWLLEKEIPFDRVNDAHPDNIRVFGSNARKISADLYIDDKQLGGLPTWDDILIQVRKLNEQRYEISKE